MKKLTPYSSEPPGYMPGYRKGFIEGKKIRDLELREAINRIFNSERPTSETVVLKQAIDKLFV